MKSFNLIILSIVLFGSQMLDTKNNEKDGTSWIVTQFFPVNNDVVPIISNTLNLNDKIISQIPEKLKPFQGVFISTPYGELWTKIKITGTNVKIWNALPSSGSWGNVNKECALKEIDGEVRVAEERSNADGSKYYYIYTSSDCEFTYYVNYFPSKTQKYSFQVEQSRASSLRKVQENYNPWN